MDEISIHSDEHRICVCVLLNICICIYRRKRKWWNFCWNNLCWIQLCIFGCWSIELALFLCLAKENDKRVSVFNIRLWLKRHCIFQTHTHTNSQIFHSNFSFYSTEKQINDHIRSKFYGVVYVCVYFSTYQWINKERKNSISIAQRCRNQI